MPSPPIVTLATGLAGAIGCDYRAATSQLIFVEYGGKLSSLKLGVPPAATYSVLGTGYNSTEDVKLSADGVHAYITERTGDLVKVALSSANRSAATVVASGMTAPQQLVLDEAHNAAYTVEYGATGHLYRIALSTGVKTPIATLNFAVGVALSADLQYAYVTEQTTGPDSGRVSRVRLSDGTRQTMVSGLTAPFFLTWADSAKTTLLVAERDPANRITAINTTSFTHVVVVSGTASRPSCVAMQNAGRLLICCDSVIQSYDLLAFGASAPLLMGIGFIPFDKINAITGLANTTVDPTYFYQVNNTPFGGTLPIMVNFQQANTLGLTHYRVKIDGTYRTDSYTDEKWNGTQYVATTTSPVTLGGLPSYPIHPTSELFLWMNPTLGGLVDSTNLSNGIHHLVLEFVPNALTPVTTSQTITLRIDNNKCIATLAVPTLHGHGADPNCGLLKYTPPAADNNVYMSYTASHPNGFANYTFQLVKGVNTLTPPTISGAVATAVSPITEPYTTLLGTCSAAGGIAAFAEYLYVAATANNGWSRQSQYDASAAIAFVLAP
jgi:hypothetical protein